MESEEYRESVRAWRNAWRPSRVRVLLIAESHVGPRPGDERVRVTVPNGRELPSSYCRLVYCLGYGEPHLCSPQPQANAGTRPFWNIVAAIALGPGIVQPTGSTIGPMRVQWKLGVLRRLRDAGVWLVDASVLPLYDPTRPRNRKKIIAGHGYRRIVRESFTQFVWPEVADEPLEQVWIIGRGVERAIREVVGRRLTGVLEQPGPGRGQHARHIEGLTRLAESVRALGG